MKTYLLYLHQNLKYPKKRKGTKNMERKKIHINNKLNNSSFIRRVIHKHPLAHMHACTNAHVAMKGTRIYKNAES